MINFTDIKNKSIVTIAYAGKDVECEVVNETPSACTVVLPSGSNLTIGKMHVKAIKATATKAEAPTTEVTK